MRNQALWAVVLSALLFTADAVSANTPGEFPFQGRLTDAVGNPLDTTVGITFKIYANLSGGSAIWEEYHHNIVVTDGLFEVTLGTTDPPDLYVWNGTTRYMSLTIGTGTESTDRIPIISTPYARRSWYADEAGRADTADFAMGVGSTGWADDGTTIRLTTPTDNIGIGTSTPEDKVHIDNSTTSGAAFLRAEASHATLWREAGFRIETPENRWHFRMDDYSHNNLPDSGSLALRSNYSGIELMTFTRDGKVGILNTLPEYPLDVRSSAVAIYGRTTGGLGVAGVYGRAEYDGFGVMGTSTSGRGVYGASTSGFGGYFLGPTTYVSGNLGIGTETPTHKLTVNGTIGVQEAGTTQYHVDYYNSGLNFVETSVADYRLMLKDGGNVGIGTGSPTAKLHVMGNVKVRDTLTAGAIFSTSIVDEMGVASAASGLYDILECNTSWQNYLSRTMRVPGPGWVLAFATARVRIHHPGSGDSDISLCLSDSPTTGNEWENAGWQLPGAAVAGYYYNTLNPIVLFRTDTAGVYTFYLNARLYEGESRVLNGSLHCFYIPTTYSYDVGAAADMPGVDVAQPSMVELPANTASARDDAAEIDELKEELTSLRQKVEALEKQRK